MSSEVQFDIVSDDKDSRVVAHWNGTRLELSSLWLRERCQDGKHLNQHTCQRLFNPHELPADQVRTFREARHELSRLSVSDKLECRFKLESGEMMMFGSNRTLHGRTSSAPILEPGISRDAASTAISRRASAE